MSSFVTFLDYIQSTEQVTGHNHPTLPDTLNRALRTLVSASGQDPDGPINSFAQVFHTHTATDITAGTFQNSGIYKFLGIVDLAASYKIPYDQGNYPRVANVNLTANQCLMGFDCTGAARTATLPAVATVPGQTYTVFKIDVSANQLILAAQGGEFISGAASKNTAAQWGKIQVISNGTIWIQTI